MVVLVRQMLQVTSISMLGVLALGEETRNMQQALLISFLRLV